MRFALRRCLFNSIKVLVCLSFLCLYAWNHYYVSQQLEAPFDHVWSVVQKPFYSLSCPSIIPKNVNVNNNNNNNNNNNSAIPFPPFFMISARPAEQVEPILKSWKDAHFSVIIVNTSKISKDYHNTRCRKATWKSRLFAVYQHMMQQVLDEDYHNKNNDGVNSTKTNRDDRNEYFFFLEDDVFLRDPVGLQNELVWALENRVDYYSFYTSPKHQNSCIYEHGTLAQLMSRKLIQNILSVTDDVFCRLPIDMYIASQGPWYKSQKLLVTHEGKRYNAG